MTSEWKALHVGTIQEQYRRDIGPFILLVWPTGDWWVLAFGKPIKNSVSVENDNVDKGKHAAEVYVEQFFERIKSDLGYSK